MNRRAELSLNLVTVLLAISLLLHVAALITPEWTLLFTHDDMSAHMGLFQVLYVMPRVKEWKDYQFCNGLSPGYNVQRCIAWRLTQITSIVSLIFVYTAVVLLIVLRKYVRHRKAEEVASFIWSSCMVAGVASLASIVAWEFLSLSLVKQHKELEDGYRVRPGAALIIMALVGSFYITSSLWWTLSYKFCFSRRRCCKKEARKELGRQQEQPAAPSALSVVVIEKQ